jgi:hypothetical protein
LSLRETDGSRVRNEHEDGSRTPPDEYRFGVLLTCRCGAVVVSSGYAYPQEYQAGEDEWEQEEALYPSFIDPAPPLFEIPKACPENVRQEVLGAFHLYWCDLHAAANRIRSAVELLLDHLRIPRSGPNRKGQRAPLKLHRRIEIFEAKRFGPKRRGRKRPPLVTHMLALKWLRNLGSHASKSKLKRNDLCDAMEILSHVLEELNVRPAVTAKITSVAREINRRRGPRRKRPADSVRAGSVKR